MAQTAQIKVFPTEPQNEAQRVLQVQRSAYLENPYPSREERLDNLKKLEGILVDNQDAIAEAIRKDFGNRAVEESKLLELFLSIDGFRYCRKHLKKWMKPQRRGVSIWFAGASNKVLAQPKGVVGVVVPWNYPLFLAMGPPRQRARRRQPLHGQDGRELQQPLRAAAQADLGEIRREHAGAAARCAWFGLHHAAFRPRDIHRLRGDRPHQSMAPKQDRRLSQAPQKNLNETCQRSVLHSHDPDRSSIGRTVQSPCP